MQPSRGRAPGGRAARCARQQGRPGRREAGSCGAPSPPRTLAAPVPEGGFPTSLPPPPRIRPTSSPRAPPPFSTCTAFVHSFVHPAAPDPTRAWLEARELRLGRVAALGGWRAGAGVVREDATTGASGWSAQLGLRTRGAAECTALPRPRAPPEVPARRPPRQQVHSPPAA